MDYNLLPCDTEHLALTGKSTEKIIHYGWNIVHVTSLLATESSSLVY